MLDQILKITVAIMVIATLLSMGMGLTLGQIKSVLTRGRLLVLAVVLNFGAIPLLALGLVKLFGLPPAEATGILICACAPAGPMGTLLVDQARGDIAVAVTLLFGLTVLATALTPPLIGIYTGSPMGPELLKVALPMIKIIVAFQLTPLILGLIIRWKAEVFAAKARPWISRFALALLIGMSVAYAIARGGTALEAGLKPGLLIALLVPICFLAGWVLVFFERPVRIAFSMTACYRNLSLAILISTTLYEPATVIAVLIYGVVMFLIALGLVVVLRWFDRRKIESVQ